MKTAISIPDDVFIRAEEFAHQRNMTRSALYTTAVQEYIRHHRDDKITEMLNEVYPKQPSSLDPILQAIQRLSLTPEEW